MPGSYHSFEGNICNDYEKAHVIFIGNKVTGLANTTGFTAYIHHGRKCKILAGCENEM